MPWQPQWQVYLYKHTNFWSGVDLFFCVSGFVIMRSLILQVEEKDTHKYWRNVIAFWVRRFYRLVPASWMRLGLMIMLSLTFNHNGTFGSPFGNISDAISQFFYLANIHNYYCTVGIGVCGKNSIFWSLSLEEQFYFLLPILIFIFKRNIYWLFIALIATQFFLIRPLMSLLWVTRTDAIAWGCILAMLSSTQYYGILKPTFLKKLPARLIISSTLLVSLAVFTSGEIFPFYLGMVAICSAIMVWICSYGEGLLFKWAMNNKFVLWIASRSYSIYLYHGASFLIIMDLCKRYFGPLNGNDTLRIGLGGLFLTALMAELSFRFIESPFRKKGKEISNSIIDK